MSATRGVRQSAGEIFMKTLGLFGKQPVPGLVKTRLASDLGVKQAALLSAAFIDDLAIRFRSLGDRRVFGYHPPTADGFFHRYSKLGYELWAQPEGDLGKRIQAYFTKTVVDRKIDRSVLIGTDSPTVPNCFVEQAFEMLGDADCVLGPATDGGVYLIGLRRNVPNLFDRMHWSQPTVLSQLVRRIGEQKLSLNLLNPWYDIDDLSDLQLLAGHLKAMTRVGETHPCPVTASVLKELHFLD